jgi:hypothetical protein
MSGFGGVAHKQNCLINPGSVFQRKHECTCGASQESAPTPAKGPLTVKQVESIMYDNRHFGREITYDYEWITQELNALLRGDLEALAAKWPHDEIYVGEDIPTKRYMHSEDCRRCQLLRALAGGTGT